MDFFSFGLKMRALRKALFFFDCRNARDLQDFATTRLQNCKRITFNTFGRVLAAPAKPTTV
jgi:hypothetical protein